jgi:hypothetical protein
MFKVETFRTIDKEILLNSKLSFPELIIEALKSIGFIDIKQQGDTISFRHHFKDPNVESFQRRYGSGSLIFKDKVENPSIRILTENTVYSILSILGNSFVFIVLNYHFIFKSKESFLFILIINSIFILFNAFGIWTMKARYRNKQQGLLDLIEEKIANKVS